MDECGSMDEFVDGEIGENSKLLIDLLRDLKKKEDFLQGQVCIANDKYLFNAILSWDST